ncbi:MAG: ferritin-like domain-containing protein [Acidobacteriota bacterium]
MINPLEIENLLSEAEVVYSWNYAAQNEKLRALYEKGKRDQWNAANDLDWSIDVDPEDPQMFPEQSAVLYGSEIWARLTTRERTRMLHENTAWRLSNFLHGEQGALLATAQIVVSVPFIDAKFYGATQVMDEGRHVEVYQRYLQEKIGITYPINSDLKSLLDLLLCDKRWDIKYLGMQIIIEGLALAAIAVLRHVYNEPLLQRLLGYVMQDEARHVAFGVISVADFYRELSETERREREEFAYQACLLMRDRLTGSEMFEKMGLPVKECVEFVENSPMMLEFRQLLFSRVIPNLKKLGLLGSHIRPKYEALGLLRFENEPTSDEELHLKPQVM